MVVVVVVLLRLRVGMYLQSTLWHLVEGSGRRPREYTVLKSPPGTRIYVDKLLCAIHPLAPIQLYFNAPNKLWCGYTHTHEGPLTTRGSSN